jgi:hypothetical protein
MTSWIKVVTHPLGLAGFALFLVFSFLGRSRQRKKPAWLAPSAFAMAFITLVGGMVLAYLQSSRPPAKSGGLQIGTIQQTSGGPSSPNVAGVQGNVSLSITAPNTSDRSPSGPLTEDNIMSMLAAGTKSDKIISEIASRGLAFQMNANLRNKFRVAGATKAVLDALEQNHKQ